MVIKDIPEVTPIDIVAPVASSAAELPEHSSEEIAIPSEIQKVVPLPERATRKKEAPRAINSENVIMINKKSVEIRPTKLKYFRNRTASIYSVLKMVPLNEFLAYEKGIFDKERDSDQILYDFLVAVFDDEKFVRMNYDNMTAADIDQILEIFGRINHINEKEEAARKNREAQAKR